MSVVNFHDLFRSHFAKDVISDAHPWVKPLHFLMCFFATHMLLTEYIPWPYSETSTVGARHLLRQKLDWLWTRLLVKAYTKVPCTKSSSILGKHIELSCVICWTIMVNIDAADKVLVSPVQALEESESLLLINGVSKLLYPKVVEFYRL